MPEREPLLPVSDSRLEELEAATSQYEAAVTEDVSMYLALRGIDEPDRRTFRVGVVADPFPEHQGLDGWLVIPYLGRHGQPLQLRFRCIADHDHKAMGHGKYKSMPGESGRMFNVGAVHRAIDELHVTEGEFDAMILNKIGLPAVAMPGAQSWMPRHRRMVAGFSRVYVWGDPDKAGSEFVSKITGSVRNARGVRLRAEDGDVSELFVKEGAAGLLARLNPGGGE